MTYTSNREIREAPPGYKPGMSLRDAAAIACLAQIAGNQMDPDVTIEKNAEVAAYWAFAFADAFIAARATGEKQ